MRTTESRSSNSISWTDSSMKVVESKLIPTVHPLGQRLLDLGERVLDAVRDRDGVRAALLADAQALRRLAVDARDAPHVLEAVLDERDVARGRPARRSPRGRRSSAGSSRSSASPSTRTLISRPSVSSRPAGSSTCSRWSAAMTSATVSRFSSSLLGVDPDADVALEVAAHRDLADAGDGLQLLLQPVAGEVGEDLRAGTGRRGRPRGSAGPPGCVFEIDRRVDVARQAALRLRDLRLHVLQREVDVRATGRARR